MKGYFAILLTRNELDLVDREMRGGASQCFDENERKVYERIARKTTSLLHKHKRKRQHPKPQKEKR